MKASEMRDQILDAACGLFESQGYHATGMSEIIRECGAPKGSLYYYFPEGKEQIAAESIRRVTTFTAERTRSGLMRSADPAEALRNLADTIAMHIEQSGFSAGSPLTTIALETATASPIINQACQDAYEQLRSAFDEKLVASGFPPEESRALSMVILAGMEGGILLSRTYHSGDPLRQAGAALAELINSRRPAGAPSLPKE